MKLPVPSRGPIDDVYLTTIVNAVNDLYDAVSSSTFNYATFDTVEAGRQSVPTSKAMMYGGSTKIITNEYVVKDTSKTWYIDLPPGFKYAPNVTCSVVNNGTSTTGNDVMLTITSVTKSRVDGVAKFTSSGNASVGVNIVAIGVPE